MPLEVWWVGGRAILGLPPLLYTSQTEGEGFIKGQNGYLTCVVSLVSSFVAAVAYVRPFLGLNRLDEST